VHLEGREGLEAARGLARALQRLHDMLVPMVGELGFAALIKRAMWLAARTADAAGFPAEIGLAEKDLVKLVEAAGTARTVRWAQQIVEQALTLLYSFLGEPLTRRLIERAFPPTARHAAPKSKALKEGYEE
jgi:hypothetical protein